MKRAFKRYCLDQMIRWVIILLCCLYHSNLNYKYDIILSITSFKYNYICVKDLLIILSVSWKGSQDSKCLYSWNSFNIGKGYSTATVGEEYASKVSRDSSVEFFVLLPLVKLYRTHYVWVSDCYSLTSVPQNPTSACGWDILEWTGHRGKFQLYDLP